MKVERIDDIVLLINKLQELELGKIFDEEIEAHRNWKGLSMGKVLEIWLSYILSEGDHRLNKLEDWVMARKLTFGVLYGCEIVGTDFADDKLATILDYLDKQDYWAKIESRVNQKFLRVYKLIRNKEGMRTLRLDATIGKGHRGAEEGGLFQFGASKHFNTNLPQFKTMLATLDTEINGFAYPLASLTVPGNTADDVLYLPILEQAKASLGNEEDLMVVGDKKLGSKSNRAHIVSDGDHYLCPLSEKQVSKEELTRLIAEEEKKGKIGEIKIGDQKVGVGFEYTKAMVVKIETGEEEKEEEKEVNWTERRLVFRSDNHAKSQIKSFEKRMKDTEEQLENLLVKKQGKRVPKTRVAVEESIAKILKKQRTENFLSVKIMEATKTKKVRAYKESPAHTEKEKIFRLEVKTEEEKVREYESRCGWCVYGSNVGEEQMKFSEVIQMYKNQFQIESKFNDLKNKVTKLMPIYLQKDNRVKSLINIMMLGLKVICGIEMKVAKSLKKNKQKLAGIYSGNPTRATQRPSAKMMLSRFTGISVSIFMEDGKPKSIGLTPLDEVQKKILKLLGVKSNIYEDLICKMKSIYSL